MLVPALFTIRYSPAWSTSTMETTEAARPMCMITRAQATRSIRSHSAAGRSAVTRRAMWHASMPHGAVHAFRGTIPTVA